MGRLSWVFAIFALAVSVDTEDRQSYSAYQDLMVSGSSGTCSQKYNDPAAQIIQSVYSTIVAADCELGDPSTYPPNYKPQDGEVFDFIVVGSGSAGSVVASRLSEISDWNILILEAGGNPTKSTEIPTFTATLKKSNLDWQYTVEPNDDNCLGMKNRTCDWPVGKVLGGSSTINYMLYLRGNAKDYEQWAADGVTNWGYDGVLSYFKKFEGMRAPEVIATPDFNKYHSTEGNVKIESWQNDEVTPLANAFADGMHELGYSRNPDVNGKTQTGFVTLQGNLQDGRRCGMAKAFLSPAAERPNLKVSKYSLVSKILIDEKTNTAYGVEFINKCGKIVKVLAKKEVIVSAGTINTAQLLMLSGIGPREDLEKLKIKVLADLPVGKNVKDHITMHGLVITLNFTKPLVSTQESMINFLFKRKSRFTSLSMVTYNLFINTVKGVDYPDMQIFPSYFLKNDSGLPKYLELFGYTDEIKKKFYEINQNSNMMVMSGAILRPKSKGKIELRSTNPKEYPKITAGYLTDDSDFDVFLRAYDFIQQFANTKGLQNFDAKVHEVDIPGCSGLEFGSKEYRKCTLRHLTTTTSHYCCSARMGSPSSTDSVLNPQLQVKGIKALRVIDASAMHDITSGNINAAVIMIGEKGSDLVKQTWLANKN